MKKESIVREEDGDSSHDMGMSWYVQFSYAKHLKGAHDAWLDPSSCIPELRNSAQILPHTEQREMPENAICEFVLEMPSRKWYPLPLASTCTSKSNTPNICV